ncbi:hypothetical protein CNYM01_13963 [Colletotrichum nymphaeae SA-01]|uniref:Uncharacterized protein n=1 Tax=Colletotrichum nymphaeae SA-01 TaxID=1460502 RepID=A0A135RTM3_9PEZI|nr:hypothetical protein CSPX01_15254 [Colletotrichum filicis]KXH27063.1 hypothetical protein CNYM01_13963 [Colletotrichum nymphaeae SA-01]
MRFSAIIFTLFSAGVLAQNGCGFPDGPDCQSLGKGANGLEQFADPDGCCLLPLRCGNGDGGERCERVSGASAGGATNNNNGNTGNTGNTGTGRNGRNRNNNNANKKRRI